jgi:hypothetical protein
MGALVDAGFKTASGLQNSSRQEKPFLTRAAGQDPSSASKEVFCRAEEEGAAIHKFTLHYPFEGVIDRRDEWQRAVIEYVQKVVRDLKEAQRCSFSQAWDLAMSNDPNLSPMYQVAFDPTLSLLVKLDAAGNLLCTAVK